MKRLWIFIFLTGWTLVAAVETVPTLNRAQQERIKHLLARAEADPSEALAEAHEIAAADRDPALWRWMGDQHAAMEAYAEAIEAYEAALTALPTYRDALLNLVAAGLAADLPERALPRLQAAMNEGLVDARMLEALGMLAEAAQDPILAETAYRQLLLRQADHGPAREGLARTLLAQERFQEAETLVRGLLDRHPDRAGLWRLYADLAQTRGDVETAVRRLETAVRLRAVAPEDRRRLMELYLVLDRPQEVLRIHRDHPHLALEAPFRLRVAEGLLGQGHLQAASEFLGEAPQVQGLENRMRLARVQARIFLLNDAPADAIAILEQALTEAPLDSGLLRLAGEAQMQADHPEAAIPHFERLSRQPGQQAEGLWLQGVATARAGDPRQAVILLEAARRIEDLPGLRRTLEQVRSMLE